MNLVIRKSAQESVGRDRREDVARGLTVRWAHMRFFSAFAVCLFTTLVAAASPEFPLRSGQHEFRFSDAEFGGQSSYPARVTIKDMHITVVVTACGGPFPCNEIIAEGTIFWHARSGQWIIAEGAEDFDAKDVGGCSAGPMTIDPERRVIWYC